MRSWLNKDEPRIFLINQKAQLSLLTTKVRHLTSAQKADMGFILEPLYAERAKQRQLNANPKGVNTKGVFPSIEGKTSHQNESSEQTAKAVGTSGDKGIQR